MLRGIEEGKDTVVDTGVVPGSVQELLPTIFMGLYMGESNWSCPQYNIIASALTPVLSHRLSA